MGGKLDKVRACSELGVIPIIIGRKDEAGFMDINYIKNSIHEIKPNIKYY